MIRKLLRPSLFRRLFLWQLLVVLLALALNFAWSVWSNVYAPGKGAIDRDMGLQAHALAGFTAQDRTPAHATQVALEVRRLFERNSQLDAVSSDFAWQIWSASGQLLSADGMAGSFAPQPPGSMPAGQRRWSGPWLVLGSYSPDGQVWAVIGQSQRYYHQLDARLLRQAVIVPLAYAVVLMLALWLAAWRGLAPLAALGRRIAERQAGSDQALSQGAAEALELQPITAALDAYAAREAGLRTQEQRFFADAAHELRTPLAVIGAQAHVLAQEPTPEGRARALEQLQHGVRRAGDVLSQVLTLSRLDAKAGARAPGAPLDLGELLAERVAEHAPRALESGHNLGLLPGQPLRITGQRAMLVAAVDNLIDNALRYTPPGSRVDVSWGEDRGMAWCAVEDDGPGIDQADRERVFQRFERGGNAQDATGSGLGLAIAREVALAHGGSLHLRATPGPTGCRMELTLRPQPPR